MKRLGRGVLTVAGALVLAWLVGNALLEVQLPTPVDQGSFPDPMPELSLRSAFAALPALGAADTSVRLLQDNAEAWAERWRLLEGAREKLDINYFILKQDVFGAAFLGNLLRKSGEGVRIRVLLDALGTRMSRQLRGNDYLDALVNTEHVKVRVYRPLRFRYLDAFLTLSPYAIFASNHDKILLADGERGLIGGRNISGEYFIPPRDDPNAFHDADLLLTGQAAGRALRAAFEAEFLNGEARAVLREMTDLRDPSADLLLAYQAMDAWLAGRPVPESVAAGIRQRGLPWLEELREAPHLKGALKLPRPQPAAAEVALLDSRTRLGAADDPISRSLIRLMRSAQREVLIQTPYFVLLSEAVEVLEETAARGVVITVVTNGPASSDNLWSQAFFMEQWPELLARIPNLRLFVSGDSHNLHAKMAVIDGQLALVGTYNLDPSSIALNSELLAAIWSEHFARKVARNIFRPGGDGESRLVRYRIKRNGVGQPLLDGERRPAIAFGPEQHCPPALLQELAGYRKLIAPLGWISSDWPWI